jgi:hypothetical protein
VRYGAILSINVTPAMIIYNVTVSIDKSVHDDWLHWMKTIHIPEVMETGHFLEYKICRVLNEEDEGMTYAFQYTAARMEDVEEYRKVHSPGLQKKLADRYKDKYVAFRTLLEVIE